jgi:hypothetical protein
MVFLRQKIRPIAFLFGVFLLGCGQYVPEPAHVEVGSTHSAVVTNRTGGRVLVSLGLEYETSDSGEESLADRQEIANGEALVLEDRVVLKEDSSYRLKLRVFALSNPDGAPRFEYDSRWMLFPDTVRGKELLIWWDNSTLQFLVNESALERERIW